MKNQPQPTVRSGEVLPLLDGNNDHLFHSREFWNKIIAVAQSVLATTGWQVTENGILFIPGSGAGELYIAGEWDPNQSYPDTKRGSQAIVFFTPDGESAGAFYTLQAAPAGISPDTGAPYWAGWPNSPPGVWA